MKKLITSLVFVLALSLCLAVPAFAASPVTADGGSDSKDVTATYATTGDVYSVAITWGSMEFTYTEEWIPEDHDYGNGVWSNATDANKITVTNHSNVAVTATLSYAQQNQSGITGTFAETSGTANDNVLELATAVGTAYDAAPTASATLTLTGTLESNATVGTVTVTIAKQN